VTDKKKRQQLLNLKAKLTPKVHKEAAKRLRKIFGSQAVEEDLVVFMLELDGSKFTQQLQMGVVFSDEVLAESLVKLDLEFELYKIYALACQGATSESHKVDLLKIDLGLLERALSGVKVRPC
jgi:hypothetical protein